MIGTTRWRSLIETVAREYPPLDPTTLESMVLIESGGNPNARSASDARGLTQVIYRHHAALVDETAERFGLPPGPDALYDPRVSLYAGGRHLRWLYQDDDPGKRSWERSVRAYFSGSYEPADSFRDGQGTSSDQHITKLRAALVTVRADMAGSEPAKEEPMAAHRFVLSAGHRNTNRGGASNEINWTYPSVLALKAAIEARGGKAWIIQEEDGDKDRTFFPGGLQAAASACVALAKKHGPFDAYISSHYNGGGSPGFHAIFPDSPTGGVDVKGNNPLDVQLCRAMRDRVKKSGTVRMLSWTRDSPGVMSERETGVGAQGYRLGEFVGTLGFRDSTARVIIEASSIDVASERAYINDSRWVRDVYCEAIVDALEDVFGQFRAAPTVPAPQPQPAPKPLFDQPDPIPELAALPAYLRLTNGAQLIRVDHTVKALKNTPRLKWANAAAPRVGPDVPAGTLFDVAYLIVNPDGALYWYSPWATRFPFADAVPYAGDVDDTDSADIAA